MKFVSMLRDKIFHKQAVDKWDKVIYWLLLAAVFLLPIFFLAPNSHPLEFNKVFLFDVIILIATVIFLLKAFIQREVILVRTYFDWLIVAFVGFYLISFIFSKSHYISLVGVSGYYSASILSIICLVLFFYLLLQVIKKLDDIFWFVFTLLGSGLLIIIFNLFQINGVYLLPWEIAKNASFNLATSSSTTLAVFTAICLFIGFGLFLLFKEKWQKIVSGVFVVLALVLLFFLDKSTALYLLAICLFIFLILATLKSKQLSIWWVVLPTIILTVVVLFIFIDVSSLIDVDVSESVILDHQTSATIAWRSFLKTPLWGSGPQTFTYDFSQYRPADFNNSAFWNLRFIKGSNEWFGWLSTIGIGGVLAMLGLGIWFLFRSAKTILYSAKADDKWSWQIILLISWLMVALASFLLPFNFILYFVGWLLLALVYKSFSLDKPDLKKISLKNSAQKILTFSITFLIVSIATVLVIFFGTKAWIADYHYVKAQTDIVNKEEISTVLNRFQKAVDLNPYETKYYLSLAQGYTTQSLLTASQPEATTDEVQQLTQKVIDNLKMAKENEPANPAIYEQEASLYDSLRQVIGNVDELSVKAYSKLVELEPASPLAHLNLGRSRLLLAQAILSTVETEGSQEEAYSLLDQAIGNFQKAKELKQNLITADYNMGLAYQTKDELDKALGAYQQVINAVPDSLEAHWQRALIYEKQEEFDKAIVELETVLIIDPENVMVREKLELLNKPPEESEDNT
jgi:tetratricopeptide (TPR) repeat protein